MAKCLQLRSIITSWISLLYGPVSSRRIPRLSPKGSWHQPRRRHVIHRAFIFCMSSASCLDLEIGLGDPKPIGHAERLHGKLLVSHLADGAITGGTRGLPGTKRLSSLMPSSIPAPSSPAHCALAQALATRSTPAPAADLRPMSPSSLTARLNGLAMEGLVAHFSRGHQGPAPRLRPKDKKQCCTK